MQLRPYQSSDAAQLADIWLAASIPAHRFVPAGYWRANRDRMEHEYLPHSENWVLEDDYGTPCGFISLLGRHIAALFVHPAAQGKGYGTTLLHHAQQLHDELTLHVYEQNTDSVHFYEYHGFTTLSRGTDSATGAAELHMRWKKPPF